MASSTPYWMMGLSTRGSISLGCALVTGKKRVPSPAAGKMAFLTGGIVIEDNLSCGCGRKYSTRPRRACGAGGRRRSDHPARWWSGHVLDSCHDRVDGDYV